MDAHQGKDGSEGIRADRLFSHRLLLIGATYIAGALSAIVILPILTKNLSAADYGIWVLVLAAVTLMPLVLDLGLPGAMVRYLAAERNRRQIQEGFFSVLLVVICTAGVASLALGLLGPVLAVGPLLGREDVIRITAAVVFVDCLNAVLFNYLRTFQRIKLYSGFITLQTFLLVAFLALTLLSGMGLIGAVLSLMASRACVMLIMLGLVVRELGLRRPSFTRIREFLGFGVPMVPGNLSDWALGSADRYLVGIILGVAFVGYYNPGYAISALILMLVNPLRFLLPAALSELYDRGRLDQVRSYLQYSLKYFLLLGVPACLGLGLLSRDILLVLTTEEIASEGHLVTPIVAFAMLLYGVQIILSQVLIVEKETKKLGTVMATTAGLNVVLNLALIPWMGILGAAASTLASIAFALVATGLLSSGHMRVEVDVKAMVKGVLASLVMGVVIWLLRLEVLPGGLVGTILAILAGVGVYLGLTVLVGTLSRDECRFFLGLLGGAHGPGDGRRA